MDVEQRKMLCKQIIKGIEDILCGFRELSNIIDSDMDIEDVDVIHTEKENVEIEVIRGELMSYVHKGFWQCMDNKREMDMLEEYLSSGTAPWKKWED